MTWGAVAGAAIGVVGGAINSSNAASAASAPSSARFWAAQKYQQQYTDLRNQAVNGTFLGNQGLSDIYGSKPDAALYQPVNLNNSLASSISGNAAATPAAGDLSSATNAANTQNAQQRISSLLPGYSADLSSYDKNTQALLNGQLPSSDVLNIVSNQNELGGQLGTPGTSTNATLKDLGLSQLQAQQQGASNFQSILGSLNQNVDPTSNLFTAQNSYYTPGQGLETNLSQAQLQQQSQQSANFLAAAPNPGTAGVYNSDMGVYTTVAGMKAGAAGAANSGVAAGGVNWGQLLGQVGQGVAGYNGAPNNGIASSGYYSQPSNNNVYYQAGQNLSNYNWGGSSDFGVGDYSE